MRNAGVWAAIVVMLFSVVIIWQSTKLDYEGALGFGPGFFPLWISVLLFVLSIVYLINSRKEIIPINTLFPKGENLREFLEIAGSMIVFVILVEWAGFVISGTIALFFVMYRSFKWYYASLLSVGITIAVFIVFVKMLAVPLPVNSFGW